MASRGLENDEPGQSSLADYSHHSMTEATRDRLITAAMASFARKGTHGTTIGDIEEGAGLTRRGGAFYKHFRSKEEVLEAGIERQIREVEGMRREVELLPLGNLPS